MQSTGTGNTLNNILIGNDASNTLTGNGGTDTLEGGKGNDYLNGGKGSDTYVFLKTDGADTIEDLSRVSGEIDIVKMTDSDTTTPVIVKQNNDLYLFTDNNNYMQVVDQFRSSIYGVERLEVSDGQYLTRQDIQTIVDTMSAINNNTGMDVMQKYNAMMADQQYQSILAQSWQQ